MALSMLMHLPRYRMDLSFYCLQSKEGELSIDVSIKEHPPGSFS